MPFQHLTYSLADGIALVTLNRPDVYNAIDEAMRQDFYALAETLWSDAPRVCIFTGAGKAFSSGGDMSHFEKEWRGPEFRAGSRRLSRFFDELEEMPQIDIAALNGPATGAGLQLALACDLRIASDMARVGYREHSIGLIPGHGGISRLVKLIGLSRAQELYFLGDLIPAEQAKAMGLLSRVVPGAALMDEAMALARRLAEQPREALSVMKRTMNAAAYGLGVPSVE